MCEDRNNDPLAMVINLVVVFVQAATACNPG
jgi:hypothetical protein